MTTEQFAYWLQGFAEINGGAPTDEQWKIVKDHLALVFDKKTPVYRHDLGMPKLGDLPAEFLRQYQQPVITC